MKAGDKVKFKNPEMWDYREHTIINVQRTHGEICYFLHYWSWTDEDDLVLVENVMEESIKQSKAESPSHYTSTKITTLDVVSDWNLDFYLGNTIKYIQRHTLKGNAVQDLKKAAHYLRLYIDKLEKE